MKTLKTNYGLKMECKSCLNSETCSCSDCKVVSDSPRCYYSPIRGALLNYIDELRSQQFSADELDFIRKTCLTQNVGKVLVKKINKLLKEYK